jgi:hypothetical protein
MWRRMQMLFDKRCTEGVKSNAENNYEYKEFSRAVILKGGNDTIDICYDTHKFSSIPREAYENEMRSHQLALSSNGIYGFAKYHVYAMMYEQNLVKPFINFAKTKGYSCVYTN